MASLSGADYSTYYYYIWSAFAGFIGMIMYKLNKHDDLIGDCMTSAEVRTLVIDKMEPMVVRVDDLKSEIVRLHESIDSLTEALNQVLFKGR